MKIFDDQMKKWCGRMLNGFLLGVDEHYSGRGIGWNLYKLEEQVARKKGFNSLIMNSTTPETYHLVTKLNYFPIVSKPYDLVYPEKHRSESYLNKI